MKEQIRSTEELLQHQRGDSANDGAEDGADKHVTTISGGLDFRFKPVAFIAGFIIGLIILFFLLASNKTISGKSYLYPLIPFKPKELKKKLTRTRMKQN